MPIYEYEDVETGKTVELYRPVNRRGDVPPNLRRRISPLSVRVAGAVLNPSDVDQAAPRALREMESAIGTSELTRQLGRSPRELRQIWNM